MAGTGARGLSGDGGPAIDATFYNPTGISLDLYGDLLIGDDWNHRIRWVNFKPHAAFAPTPDRGFSPLAVTFTNKDKNRIEPPLMLRPPRQQTGAAFFTRIMQPFKPTFGSW